MREVKERQLPASLRLEPGKLLLVDSIRDHFESQKILLGLAGVLPYVVLQGDLHQTGGELIHDTWATLVQGVVAFPILLQIGSPLSWILLGNPSAAASRPAHGHLPAVAEAGRHPADKIKDGRPRPEKGRGQAKEKERAGHTMRPALSRLKNVSHRGIYFVEKCTSN